MTSKLPFTKFLKTNIKNRGWLLALNSIVMFILLPVYTLMRIENTNSSSYTMQTFSAPATSTDLLEMLPGLLNGMNNLALAVGIVILSALCAITGFSYLHSKEQQDFYHSLPLSRAQWFFVSYASGLLIFLVPYLLFSCCTILLLAAQGMLIKGILLLCIRAIIGVILGFLLCYHTGILAMFLTGRIVTGVLATLVLFVYGSLLFSLYSGLANTFFDTFTGPVSNGFFQIETFSSPLILFYKIISMTALSTASFGFFWGLLLFSLLCITILFVISFLLYKYYPAEAAGNALSFSKSAPFIKWLITVPTALFIGLSTTYFIGMTNRKWTFIFSVFSAFLLCMLIEYIYHRDLRQLFVGKISSVLSFGSVLFILSTLQFDLAAYDNWLPKEKKVESISISCTELSSYFIYPMKQADSNISFSMMDASELTNFEPFYNLAQEGILNLEQGITPAEVLLADSNYEYTTVTLCYVLKNKKEVYRQYAVSKESLLHAMDLALENESLKKEIYPIFHINREDILDVLLTDIYNKPAPLSLNAEEKNLLLDAYEEDVLASDFKSNQLQDALGELSLTMPDPFSANVDSAKSSYSIGQLYIYSSYKNTLAFLQKHEITIHAKINPDDVVSMTYYPNQLPYYSKGEDLSETQTAIPIADLEKQKEYLSKISYSLEMHPSWGNQKVAGSVEILLHGRSYPNTYIMLK